MPLSITSAPRQLSDGNSIGTIMGQSPADPIGFFGLAAGVPQMLQGTLLGINGALNVNAVSSSPTSVLANTTSEKSFTVVGVASTDMVVAAIKPTTQAGLVMGTARVSATNTIMLSMGNVTAANLTPTTTETYLFVTVPAAMQFSAVLSPASVAASTTAEQSFAVPGVQPGMVVAVNKPTLQAGLMITSARVISAGNVGITFMNVTAGALTPTVSQTYLFFASQGLRRAPLMQNIAVALTPASVAAITSAEQTFTVAGMGLASGQPVEVTGPPMPAGLSIGGARISAANTLAINFCNITAGALTPTPGATYQVGYFADPNVPAAAAQTLAAAAVGVESGNELNRLGLTG